MLARVQALILSLWAGMVVTLGAVVAPGLFSVLARADAGHLAGYFFGLEARLSLGLAVVCLLIERGLHRRGASRSASAMSAEALMVLLVLFLTIVAQYVLHPLLEAARDSGATGSFGLLHGLSSGLFVLKAMVLVALVWRAGAAAQEPA